MLEIHPLAGGSPAPNADRPRVAVDLAVLDRLITEMGMPRHESLPILVQAYLEQADVWMADLTAAAHHSGADQVGLIAHTLGSSSALIGASPLADLLAEAGRLARSQAGQSSDRGQSGEAGGCTELVAAVKSVESEYQLVAVSLRAECASTSTSRTSTGSEE